MEISLPLQFDATPKIWICIYYNQSCYLVTVLIVVDGPLAFYGQSKWSYRPFKHGHTGVVCTDHPFGLGVCGIPKYGSESEFQKPNRTEPNFLSNSEKLGIPKKSEFRLPRNVDISFARWNVYLNWTLHHILLQIQIDVPVRRRLFAAQRKTPEGTPWAVLGRVSLVQIA